MNTYIYIYIYSTSLTLRNSVLVPFSYTILHRHAAHTCITSSVFHHMSIHPSIHSSIYLPIYPAIHLISSYPIYPKCSLQDRPISHHSLQPLIHSIGLFGNSSPETMAFPIKSIIRFFQSMFPSKIKCREFPQVFPTTFPSALS